MKRKKIFAFGGNILKVCFVSEMSLNAFWNKKLDKIGKVDLLAFGFNGLGLVSYKKELDGETEFFHDIAKLSKQIGGVVISGLDTDTYGIYRHSAVIADKGKILGVTDTSFTIDEGEFKSGGNFRVYETSVGKIGVIVGEDIYFAESVKVLSLTDSDIIINVFKKVESSMPQIMMRAGSFSGGVTIAMLAENYLQASNPKGEIIFATSKDILETEITLEKEFHLISLRRRGYSADNI